ncbi:hypothetical protein ACGFWI_28440 [Streptomyces sp. NPDC048434]|uniref:hypothetical protein n=1 Tax=Streptomyces sp. NPDC048434 TaxID=3365549 RepID=UPI003721AEC0
MLEHPKKNRSAAMVERLLPVMPQEWRTPVERILSMGEGGTGGPRPLSENTVRTHRRPARRSALTHARGARRRRGRNDGLTNSQIATRINHSPHTAIYHLRKMFGTLSVRSRSELAGTVRPRLWEAP